MEDKKEMLKKINNRFNRVVGQIKALQEKIEKKPESDCGEIVFQIKAARSALKKISDTLLEQKLKKDIDTENKNFKNVKEVFEIMSKEY